MKINTKNTLFYKLLIIFFISFFLKILRIDFSLNNLPTLIISSLIPISLYFLIKEINHKSEKLAIISAIVLTFNPYNIYFSPVTIRTDYFFLLLLLVMWISSKYLNSKQPKYLILVLISITVFFNLFFINYHSEIYSQDKTRTNIIISETNYLDYNLFHNQSQLFSRNFLTRYFNYFSSKQLIFEGDWQKPKDSTPYIGVILFPSLFFFIFGIFVSLSSKKIEHINILFLIWLLIAPIPAALSSELVQADKAYLMSIPLVYFISLGILFISNKYKNKLTYFIIIFSYFLSFFYYLDMYLNHFSK